MFESEYYCLVAGLRELTLESENKGLDPKAIIEEIVAEVSARDSKAIRLLYTYYDCENIAAARAGRLFHNPLGNLSAEQIQEELSSPHLVPAAVANVIKAFAAEGAEEVEEVDTSCSFERALFEAYYAECARSSSRFIRSWSQTECTLRNVAAAIGARSLNIAPDEVVVGQGDIAEALRRSAAADFGLRGELPYIDALIAAINDEPNILEKEHKIDNIRWAELDENSCFDYFNISAVMAYLVKLNIVARWRELDVARGRAMLERLMSELSAKDKINK